ncbi:MAG: zinc ribbon-containing protein [Parashewanella sp.]
MSERSNALLTLYHQLIEHMKNEYQRDHSLTAKDLYQSVSQGKQFLRLKNISNGKELDLVEEFLKRDISAFLQQQNAQDLSISPTLISIENTLWHWLGEITDKSQVEWYELVKDLNQDGIYQAGEIVSQGRMICEKCGHNINIEFPCLISDCPECEGREFLRLPLNP